MELIIRKGIFLVNQPKECVKMKKIILILFLINLSFAKNINTILSNIAVNNDLSNKTKKENSGVLYLLTREDICSLQIKHLRDVLKILPIDYKFNRYGITDVFNPNTNIPFLSSPVKVFIDNQEIVSGFYNSGLAILGDMDLGWVDHIEVYTQAPSLDVSTEPSLIVIKLYSKRASRDEGNNIYLSKGIKNSLLYFEKAKSLDKYSYYTYISNDNEKSSYNNSKFKKTFLLHIYNPTSSFLLNGDFINRDGFLGFSLDGKPDNSYIKNRYLHMGYDKKIGDFEFFTAFNFSKAKTYYYETPILFFYKNQPIQKADVISNDRLIDLNIKYKKEINKNIILAGIKNRFKYFNWTTLKFNNENIPKTNRHTQSVHTAFMQISRFLSSNSLINFGYSMSVFQNNAGFKNQKTKQYRFAHTYLKNDLILKTAFSHIEYTIDPYLINSIFLSKKILKPASINNIFENIKYKKDLYSLNISFGYFISKNYFFPNSKGLLDNLDKRMNEKYFSFGYDYRYMPFSKFSFNYYFQYIKDIPKVNIFRMHKVAVYNYNTIKKYNFFEELVMSKEGGTKVYYNLSLGAKYAKNDNLTFFVKGENLLNRGEEYNFFSFNPLKQKFNSPVTVPFIERRVVAGAEYSF